MMKRMICCLLAVFLLLGMVGCAGKTEVDGTKPGETTGATEPADPTEGVTEPGVTDPTEEVTEPGAAGDVTEPEVTETPTQDATEAPTEGATEAPTEGATEAPTEGATEAPTQDATEAPSEETVEDPTEAPTEAPTEPEVTEATEAAPSEPEVTDPGEVELPAVPTVPATEAPVEPTVPATEAPAEPTSPATTEPAVTEPPATEPPATEPPATEHTHTYSSKVVKPTCTKKGYTKYTCDCGETYKDAYTEKLEHSYSSKVVKPTCEKKGYTLYTCDCGESYKDNYTKAGAHDYQAGEVVEATMWKEGYTTYTCSRCGDSYEGDKTDKIPQKEFERLVAEAVVKYINQYRVAQGDTEAQMLPGLTLVAEYRSVQLLDNFEHSTKDLREAYAHYQYGEWVDMSDLEELGFGKHESYYTANAKEAIAKRGGVLIAADRIGKNFADQLRNSSGHWAYVGDSKYPFIGIGMSYSNYDWYCCVLQTSENYG